MSEAAVLYAAEAGVATLTMNRPAVLNALDDALLAGLREVRIVHGYGTGALKKAVREYLDDHAEVLSWREAPPNEGGGGATVARLEDED